ncbi:MAG: type III pantothenate kinase [Spirochaetes bacterium DG_61]|nr:MAG: type III pantothenate kinase [Spirochaetes bacterium DG_61]
MLLCIDIGNTNLVLGLWKEGKWLAQWRIRTDREKMPDEYVLLLKALLGDRGYDLRSVTRVVIGSVVPRLKKVFRDLFEEYVRVHPLILGPGVRTGLRILIDNPTELGADLVADAVAAYHRLRTACIIVDFGTATTFSAVSAEGDFLGVAIAPGLEVAVDALSSSTAQLPRISLSAPPKVIGTNTVHSMQSGLIYGYVGLVEGLIKRIRQELGEGAQVIATGGLSRILAPYTREFNLVDPELTLDGLRIIGERNLPPE